MMGCGNGMSPLGQRLLALVLILLPVLILANSPATKAGGPEKILIQKAHLQERLVLTLRVMNGPMLLFSNVMAS